MKTPVILRIFKDNTLMEIKQFELDQILIGSEDGAQIKLLGDKVAAIHCLIEKRDSGYYVCDLGSESGTFKNSTQILDEPISSGDQIKVGAYTIHFFVGVPKPKAPPAPQISETPAVIPSAPPIPVSVGVPQSKVSPAAVVTRPPKPSGNSDDRSRRGSSVEVTVQWKDRYIDAYYLQNGDVIGIGQGDNCIYIPEPFIIGKLTFIEVIGNCKITIPSNCRAEVQSSRKTVVGSTVLEQGEVINLSFESDLLVISIRYCPAVTKPVVSPIFDFTSGESTGIVMTLVIVALTALYMSVYSPPPPEKEKEEDHLRVAQFIYDKPTPTPTPKKEASELEKITQQATATPTPTPTPEQKKVVKVTDQKQEQDKVGKKESKAAVSERVVKVAAEVAKIPSKVERPKKFTSVKSGGSVKIGKTEGANAKSANATNVGLMAAFGGGGVRSKLDQAYSGAGDLIGQANKASGNAGQNKDRAGDDLGSKFKDTGAGGSGTATEGISGIGTKGRSSGQGTYGGLGVGGKGQVAIDAGGNDAQFVGTIDREAVRRVIRSKLNEIKSCYERGLNLDKSLEGKVVIQFLIEEQGRVRTAKTKFTTLHSKQVEECVAARIRNAIFPEPPPGTVAEVDYPFVFGAQN